MTVTVPIAFLETMMLVSVRMAAFLVIAPPFAHRAVPGRVKAMLAVGLALAVAPRLPGERSASEAAFVGDLVMQVVIGAALGFLVYLAFAAVAAAGSLLDLFGGFQMAQAFDPMSMVNGAQFAKLFQMTAITLLFASGAYQPMLAGLARTFDALPLGAVLDLSRMGDAAVHGVAQMFLAALQIAGPLLIVLFLADVGLGLVTRVAPALNAFALGFPLKILLTLSLATFVFLALPRIVSALTGTAVTSIVDVAGLG